MPDPPAGIAAEGAPVPPASPAIPPPTPDPAPDTPTTGGDGSAITLLPLDAAQLATVELAGELGCSLHDADGRILLVARADVAPEGMVRAAVNHGGYVEVLGNGRAGGFNDLLDGITLHGKGLTVVLARGASQRTGDESTAHGATLTVQRADGAERDFAGTWRCGP